jgi:hypothetical protein
VPLQQQFVKKLWIGAWLPKLDCLRLDTWGDNEELSDYYQQCGFTFLGVITPDYNGLPKHYDG